MAKKQDKPKKAWDPEQQFDLGATLEDLLAEVPFREASGDSGDSITTAARVPVWLHRRIVKLKEMSNSPYDVTSDVVRDALFTGLRILNMRYKMSLDWNVESKMAAVVDSASTSRRLKRQVTELADGLDDLWREGDEQHAADSLSKYVHAALELESDWYRKKLFTLLGSNKAVQQVAKACKKEVRDIIERESK